MVELVPGMAEGAPAVQSVTLRELTGHQKREVLAITASGFASAVFFLIPFLPADPPPLPSTPTTVQVVTVTQSPRTFELPRLVVSAAARPRTSRLLTASRTEPMMMIANSTTVSVGDAPANSSKSPRGLTRLLFGSGRYRVQPFPTPSEQ